ncbi:CU044_2847 family protein [Nonomuraea sp. NPDC003214]
MSNVVPIELPDGEVILARVRVEGPSDVGATRVLQKLPVDDLRKVVNGVAGTVADAVESVRPDQVSVEFGIEIAVKSGKVASVLAEAGGKASLKLTLTWDTARDKQARGAADSDGEDEGEGTGEPDA